MAISLEADNRILTSAAKYSYLLANYISSTSNLSVLNATDSVFATDAYLLLGNFGSEVAEIVQIATVNNTTGAITLVAPTKFAHSESTRVTVLPYNQIRFFWTPIEVFNTSTPLTVYLDIQPSDWFTTYDDASHPTGFGWFIFYNSTTLVASQQSNSLPYAGFERDTVEDMLNDFFSLLNNKELKLVTRTDALSWLDEANSKVRNRLNLTNREFSASDLSSFTTQPGIYEYDLPTDFWGLVSIQTLFNPANPIPTGYFYDNSIDFIPLREAFAYPSNVSSWPGVRYYIRGRKIGILPVPTAPTTYSYMYLKKTTRVRDNSSAVDLPDNGFFILKDWMMYRASLKFKDQASAAAYLKTFTDGLNEMIVASIDRDANLDTMGITTAASS